MIMYSSHLTDSFVVNVVSSYISGETFVIDALNRDYERCSLSHSIPSSPIPMTLWLSKFESKEEHRDGSTGSINGILAC